MEKEPNLHPPWGKCDAQESPALNTTPDYPNLKWVVTWKKKKKKSFDKYNIYLH